MCFSVCTYINLQTRECERVRALHSHTALTGHLCFVHVPSFALTAHPYGANACYASVCPIEPAPVAVPPQSGVIMLRSDCAQE